MRKPILKSKPLIRMNNEQYSKGKLPILLPAASFPYLRVFLAMLGRIGWGRRRTTVTDGKGINGRQYGRGSRFYYCLAMAFH
jgi:hypothetical protein